MNAIRSNSGFSTILAVLLTGFLIVLSAGILFLFLSESQINRALYDGISSYHAAEGAMEYALLKTKNHREWFEDELDFTSPDGQIFAKNGDKRAPAISYTLENNATNYSGTIASQGFEIIPLFYENGKQLSTTNGKIWKSPLKPDTVNGFDPDGYKQTKNFELAVSGTVVWNVIGNNASGKTFGLSWQWSQNKKIGVSNDPSILSQMDHLGSMKDYSAWVLTESTKDMKDFLNDYQENYLVLYNTNNYSVNYAITSTDGFSLPTSRIIASAKIKNSIVNLELTEDKSRLFEALKYSLFVK